MAFLFPLTITGLFLFGKKQKLQKQSKKLTTKIKNFRFKKGNLSFDLVFKNNNENEIKIDEIKVDFISQNKIVLTKSEKNVSIPPKKEKTIKITADLVKFLSVIGGVKMKITIISGQTKVSKVKKLI